MEVIIINNPAKTSYLVERKVCVDENKKLQTILYPFQKNKSDDIPSNVQH